MTEEESWDEELARRIGREVQRVRKDVRDWSAAELSRRCGEAGYPISRGSISQIENGLRGGKFGVAEWLILASVLGVPPAQLLYSDLPDGEVAVVPGRAKKSVTAVRWLVGHAHVEPLKQWSRTELVTRLQLAQRVRDSFEIPSLEHRRKELLERLAAAQISRDELEDEVLPRLLENVDRALAELRSRIKRPQPGLARASREVSVFLTGDLAPGELDELLSPSDEACDAAE